MTLKNMFVIAFAIIFSSSAFSQISKVNYRLKFNEKTNLFDCYLVVKQGQANTIRERAQFNAQYTLLVPTGTKVEVAKNYNPIQANQNETGTKPMDWVISNTVKKPQDDPFYDFVSLAPSLAPAAFYNSLKEGQEVLLFSLKMSPIRECGANIKIYDNGIDLSSGARGMAGGDFSNGFTMGGVDQKYLGNDEQVTPKANVLGDIKTSIKSGILIEPAIVGDNAYGPYTYEWFGPSSFYSEKPNIQIAKPTLDQFGKYKLIVTDSRGCQDEKEVDLYTNVASVNDVTKLPEILNQISTTTSSKSTTSTAEANISLYPNPTTTNLIVTILANKGANVKADILDISGRVISNQVINKTFGATEEVFELPVSDLKAGTYSLSVKIDDKETTKRFIVIQ